MKKYRAGKIKREHSIIEKLWPVLEEMAECDLITSIIPGPISPLNAKAFEVTFQRFTDTGLRLLAKNGSAVQEVYVVTPEKLQALSWLGSRSIVEWRPEPPPADPKPAQAGEALKTVVLASDMACDVCGKPMLAGARVVQIGKRNFKYAHKRCAK